MDGAAPRSCGAKLSDHTWGLDDRRWPVCTECGREPVGKGQRNTVAGWLGCRYDGVEYVPLPKGTYEVAFAFVSCPARSGDHRPRQGDDGRTFCAGCGEIAQARPRTTQPRAKAGKRHGPKQPPPAPKPRPEPVVREREPETLTGLGGVRVTRAAQQFIPHGQHGNGRVGFIAQWYADHGRRCFYCGVKMDLPRIIQGDPATGRLADTAPTIEHLLPVSRGGKNERDNLVVACNRCNNRKGDSMGHLIRSVLALWERLHTAERNAVACASCSPVDSNRIADGPAPRRVAAVDAIPG